MLGVASPSFAPYLLKAVIAWTVKYSKYIKSLCHDTMCRTTVRKTINKRWKSWIIFSFSSYLSSTIRISSSLFFFNINSFCVSAKKNWEVKIKIITQRLTKMGCCCCKKKATPPPKPTPTPTPTPTPVKVSNPFNKTYPEEEEHYRLAFAHCDPNNSGKLHLLFLLGLRFEIFGGECFFLKMI